MGSSVQKKRSKRAKRSEGAGRSPSGTKPPRLEVNHEELSQIVARTQKGALSDQEHQTLRDAIDTLIFLTAELEAKGATIRRLRRLIFGASSEKTSAVVGDPKKPKGGDGESPSVPTDVPDPDAGGGSEAPDSETGEEARKRPGHGRHGQSAYTGADRVPVGHESLKPGDRCPECGRGKVYRLQRPSVLIRVVGMAPLSATLYELERLRCNLCGQVFTARPPEGVEPVKYDETAATMIGLLRYGCGFPFNRLERLEGGLGIPLPASTQWEVEADAAELLSPAFDELIRQAAQGKVLHNDDTTMRILGLKEPEPVEAGSKKKPRSGIFTTGIVSIDEGHQIALFFTGRNHAGENLADVLSKREEELGAPIQMCDSLSRNTAGDFETIVANCLAHARRYFVDVSENFPEEVRYVLEKLREVYKVDAEAKKLGLNDEERLRLHQRKSSKLMESLKKWLDRKIKKKEVEPNSSLGQAIEYMRDHWRELTLFLRVPGAPLDNNICERALKKAILHRKGSLFYKTKKGARVGDLFMSLIHTCELNEVGSFDYLVALQRHHREVAEHPEEWMPWNYEQALARLGSPPRS